VKRDAQRTLARRQAGHVALAFPAGFEVAAQHGSDLFCDQRRHVRLHREGDLEQRGIATRKPELANSPWRKQQLFEPLDVGLA